MRKIYTGFEIGFITNRYKGGVFITGVCADLAIESIDRLFNLEWTDEK
jgi:hypothetical protein